MGRGGEMRKPGLKGISLHDARDVPYTLAIRSTFPADIPRVKDLICSPVADQGDLGSCGSFASVYNLVGKAVQNNEEPMNLSQLFLYYTYREKYGDVASDGGVINRELLLTLASVGVCVPTV